MFLFEFKQNILWSFVVFAFFYYIYLYNASIVVGQFSERFGQERFYGTKGRERKLKVLQEQYQQGLWRGIKSDAQAALGLRPQACPI